MSRAFFRLKKSSSIANPIQIRSAGNYVVKNNWHDKRMKKDFFELFWCMAGVVDIIIENQKYQIKENQMACYFPGDFHQVSVVDSADLYWITFDGNYLQTIIDSFKISRYPCVVNAPLAPLFEKIFLALTDFRVEGEIQASLLGYELLLQSVYATNNFSKSLVERFIETVEKNYQNLDLSITELAKEFQIHRSTLMRQITLSCGLSPQKYIETYRIQNAIELLQESRLSIKEITHITGFANANYFAKVFKRHTGETPSFYRKNICQE